MARGRMSSLVLPAGRTLVLPSAWFPVNATDQAKLAEDRTIAFFQKHLA